MQDWIDEIRDRLDTEPKAILCPAVPDKLVAIGTEAFSLLLINRGPDDRRIDPIVASIRKKTDEWKSEYPFLVAHGLTLDDALAGQLALATCDCVSAFVRDEIIDEGATETFHQLHSEVMRSKEFQSVEVRVSQFPQTDEAIRICWQFFGFDTGLKTSLVVRMFRKKARLFARFATELSAIVIVKDI